MSPTRSSASAQRNGGHNETVYGPEAGGTRYYLWTTVAAQRDGEAHALTGGMQPAAVWLNHQRSDKGALAVRRGANPLLLRYDAPGRGYFVVSTRRRSNRPTRARTGRMHRRPSPRRWR